MGQVVTMTQVSQKNALERSADRRTQGEPTAPPAAAADRLRALLVSTKPADRKELLALLQKHPALAPALLKGRRAQQKQKQKQADPQVTKSVQEAFAELNKVLQETIKIKDKRQAELTSRLARELLHA